MDLMTRYIFFTIAALLIIALGTQAKNKNVNKSLLGTIIGYGFFVIALGISNLAAAGSINAILVFESARDVVAQSSFDALHKTLDPHLFSGYTHIVAGALLLGLGISHLHKNKE